MFHTTERRRDLNPAIALRTSRWRVVGCLSLLLAMLAAPVIAADGDKDEPPPEPVDVGLPTKDPVVLHATYYASNEGKEAVPVILLHMSEGKRSDYQDLALFLQAQGHAVLVPDLRGHGDSTELVDSKRSLDAKRLPTNQYPRMVLDDMEACKKFLIKEHNNENLNIERLCVVGAEMGAAVAVNWAALDWSWPVLAVGKQGQDVGGLVLISPRWSFKSLRLTEAMADDDVRSKIAVYIIVGGNNSRELSNAKRVHKALEPYHSQPSNGNASKRDLFFQSIKTSLQGTDMLGEELGVAEQIAKFIELRLVGQNTPWKAREVPLGQ